MAFIFHGHCYVFRGSLQLLSLHRTELDELERRLTSEQSRQQLSLRDKLARLKERKLAAQQRDHEREEQAATRQQQQRASEEKLKRMQAAEKEAIIVGLQENSAEAADVVVKMVGTHCLPYAILSSWFEWEGLAEGVGERERQRQRERQRDRGF